MKKVMLGLFVAASIAELAGQFLSLEQLHHIVKPMLMLLLGAYYFVSAPRTRRSWVVITALFFSFLGDSFLLYEPKDALYFMLGLGSFLVAHLFYIVSFRQERYDDDEDQLHRVQKVRMAFPIILAATGLVVVLYPRLGDLRIPVVIYATVIMFMVLNALFRFERTNNQSFWMVFTGAILFMISDSILAINKFLQPLSAARVWIMLSYLSAQYLIIEGLLSHERKES